MADVGVAIRAVLAADGAVSGVVSTRIYPDQLPQNVTYPAIHYEHSSEFSHVHMTGISGLADSYIDVICHAATRLAATSLAEKVRLALSHYEGTSSGVVVRRVVPGNGTTDIHDPDDNSDLPTYYHEREYHVWYCEATS
jgi:hypothetical protein